MIKDIYTKYKKLSKTIESKTDDTSEFEKAKTAVKTLEGKSITEIGIELAKEFGPSIVEKVLKTLRERGKEPDPDPTETEEKKEDDKTDDKADDKHKDFKIRCIEILLY